VAQEFTNPLRQRFRSLARLRTLFWQKGLGAEMCGRARCTLRVDAVASACGFQAPLRSINSDRLEAPPPSCFGFFSSLV